MTQYVKEKVQAGELEVYAVLTRLASLYNDHFSTLVLPYALKIDKKNKRLTMPRYMDVGNNLRWDESDGGSLISVELVTKILALIEELAKIPIAAIVGDESLREIPKFLFDHDEALDYFCGLAANFCEAELLSATECDRIEDLLRYKQTSKRIFNNGDFYPRNLIEQEDGKLVLIDWETWNEHSPFYTIDHIENVAAVMYVHMWGNPDWQAACRQGGVHYL